ncbi:MAG: NUDIX hydrolase [Solirubrobacteraceae bacterium]
MSSDEAPLHEHSAGGAVIRGDEVVVIVPHKRSADGRRVVGLPKGHIEPGETAEQAAAREVAEEGGVQGRLVSELGDVSYEFRRGGRTIGKQVRFFLFHYVSGDPTLHDHEVEQAWWMPLERAVEELTYPGEREIARRALLRIASDR